MNKLWRTPALLVMAAVALAFAGLSGLSGQQRLEAAVHVIEIQLSGAQENPPVTNSTGSAFARLTFDDATRVLTYDVTVSGLSPTQVTAAHIHRGAAGVNGPIIHNLSTTGFTQVSGRIQLSEADVADLIAGNLYVNVHSTAHPGGFARGQIYLPDQIARMTLNAAADAWNRRDVARFLTYFNDNGLMSSFEATRAEAQQFLPQFIGDPAISFVSFGPAVSTGSHISVIADIAFGAALERTQFTLVQQDGMWKVEEERDLPYPIPAGVNAVRMDLQEFAFVYDRAQLASGNFAIQARNIGAEPHEVAIVNLGPSFTVQQLLQLEGPNLPAGVELFAVGGPWAPGTTNNMVFTRPLAAGRYALVCFIESPDGIPHAFKGMVSEFSVGPATTAPGIRPPSTGDAGLLAATDTTLSFGLLVAAVGFGLLALFSSLQSGLARKRA